MLNCFHLTVVLMCLKYFNLHSWWSAVLMIYTSQIGRILIHIYKKNLNALAIVLLSFWHFFFCFCFSECMYFYHSPSLSFSFSSLSTIILCHCSSLQVFSLICLSVFVSFYRWLFPSIFCFILLSWRTA